MAENIIITIARQYGSGGREVGEIVAKNLGMVYHDKSLIKLAAEKSGLSEERLESVDEKPTPSFLYSVAVGAMGLSPFTFGVPYDTPMNDKLFKLQSEIIKEEADKAPSVFVGRCADFVLSDHPRLVRVFIYADIDKRAERIAKRNNIEIGEAKNKAIKTDKRRANYYNYYTSRKWGKSENYDLMIDTSKIGPEGAAKIIEEYVNLIK